MFNEISLVSRLTSRLEGFTKKSDKLWNASCPICGDISKGKKKKRFYIFPSLTGKHLSTKCHHCGYSAGFISFLKSYHADLYKEYIFRHWTEKKNAEKNIIPLSLSLKITDTEITPTTQVSKLVLPKQLIPLSSLPNTHILANYVRERKIPETKYQNIFYVEKFGETVNSILGFEKFKSDSLEINNPRMVFPVVKDNELIGLVGRALLPTSNVRYFTISVKNETLVYGLPELDLTKRVYVVEGIMDSFFLPNSVAALGSALSKVLPSIETDDIVFVFDNEPRNKEICAQILRHIDARLKVCLWPESVLGKDINEMICNGMTEKDILDTINRNVYTGLEARARFSQWKKVDAQIKTTRGAAMAT